jgi:hypothetical protein
MTITALTTGLQTVSATGAVSPTAGVDISAMSKQVTVCIECIQLTASKTIAVQLETSTNAFTASVAANVFQFIGAEGEGGTTFTAGDYTQATDKRSVIVKQQLPFSAANYFGASGAKARLNVIGVDGSAGGTFNAWLET